MVFLKRFQYAEMFYFSRTTFKREFYKRRPGLHLNLGNTVKYDLDRGRMKKLTSLRKVIRMLNFSIAEYLVMIFQQYKCFRTLTLSLPASLFEP